MTTTTATIPTAAPAARRSLPHLPALDGVRGLAILLVLVHHFLWIDDMAMPAWVRPFQDSLFIGVDLFFVLSGFLITRILLQARGEPHYFRNFYIRRTLRIFPLYYVFLAGVFLFWVIGGRMLHLSILQPPESLSVFPWVMFFAGNILIVMQAAPLATALNPLWSLSVEEHFYLVWPTLMRFISPRTMLVVCGAIIVGTCGLRFGAIALFDHLHKELPESTLSYFTLFRADGLAAGAALAIMFYLEWNERWISRIAGAMVLLTAVPLIAAAFIQRGLHYRENLQAAWMYTTLAFFFWAFLALLVRHPMNPAARFLGTPFMRFFGKYSYGIYIFNLPVWVYLGNALNAHKFPSTPPWHILLLREAIAIPLTIGLAILSWNVLEKRCLKLKARFEPKGVDA